jgi:hypothetical protein
MKYGDDYDYLLQLVVMATVISKQSIWRAHCLSTHISHCQATHDCGYLVYVRAHGRYLRSVLDIIVQVTLLAYVTTNSSVGVYRSHICVLRQHTYCRTMGETP